MMYHIQRFQLWCDRHGCRRQGPWGQTREDALERARLAGWRCQDGWHWCPDHAAQRPERDGREGRHG